ncbi:hypothetical protein OK016_04850 [Vibrio chagasii]|nr:hypothetical protein [Vibrio chagasii]
MIARQLALFEMESQQLVRFNLVQTHFKLIPDELKLWLKLFAALKRSANFEEFLTNTAGNSTIENALVYGGISHLLYKQETWISFASTTWSLWLPCYESFHPGRTVYAQHPSQSQNRPAFSLGKSKTRCQETADHQAVGKSDAKLHNTAVGHHQLSIQRTKTINNSNLNIN